MTEKPVNWFNGILQDENDPIRKARWISMQAISSVVNVENDYTFIDQNRLTNQRITLRVADIKAEQPIVLLIIFVKACLMKSCCEISVK